MNYKVFGPVADREAGTQKIRFGTASGNTLKTNPGATISGLKLASVGKVSAMTFLTSVEYPKLHNKLRGLSKVT